MPETHQPADLDPELYRQETEEEPLPFRAFTRRRIVSVLLVVLAILLLVVVPPLFNVGRFRKQIASSLAASLGRPVHIDSVTLNLLPLPGFTLENFVVGEDSAFGAEPVLRAEEVRATLRFGSLWRRRLEFSRIALTDPSINLVHLPDGRWNFESILLQASHIPATPTTQRRSGGGPPRFPYIEATGARLNIKEGAEKTPFSLTEGDLALWLPEPGEWHVRVKAHPARTDTAASDTGTLRLDGTLGQAATLKDVPLHLRIDWNSAPLGALSLILTGRDMGLRGTMNLEATLDGTAGKNRLVSKLTVEDMRRADFVPRHSLTGTLSCTAQMSNFFHAVDAAHCSLPGDSDDAGLSADLSIPDTLHPATAAGTLTLHNIPTESLLDGLRVASNRISPDLASGGLLSGSLSRTEPAAVEAGGISIGNASLSLPGQRPFFSQTVTATLAPVAQPAQSMVFAPISLDLGGQQPAVFQLQLIPGGAAMELTGDAVQARLAALAQAFPLFGDGMEAVLPTTSTPSYALNLTGEHGWTSGQTWSRAPAEPAMARRGTVRRHRRR